MGGEDTNDNLVRLSVEDHINAHFLLSACFEENSYEYLANLRSARLLMKKSVKTTEEMHKIQKAYIGENNPFYNKSHTQETRDKLSAHATKQLKGVSYEQRYGNDSLLEKEKRSKGVANSWKEMDSKSKEDRINKIKKALKGKTPWNAGKRCSYLVDGVKYESMNTALDAFGYKFPKKLRDNHIVIKINETYE